MQSKIVKFFELDEKTIRHIKKIYFNTVIDFLNKYQEITIIDFKDYFNESFHSSKSYIIIIYTGMMTFLNKRYVLEGDILGFCVVKVTDSNKNLYMITTFTILNNDFETAKFLLEETKKYFCEYNGTLYIFVPKDMKNDYHFHLLGMSEITNETQFLGKPWNKLQIEWICYYIKLVNPDEP